MTETPCSQRNAASVIFNLPNYHVIDAVDLPAGGRRAIMQADEVAAVNTLAVVDDLHVTQLGVDERRYRKVQRNRNPDTGSWQRVEPWMTTLVNVPCSQALAVVNGRDSTPVTRCLDAHSPACRDRIQVMAIDPSAAFKKAITLSLPNAAIAVDPLHLVQLANQCVTRVRQRLVQTLHQRRGRNLGPPHPAASRLRDPVRARQHRLTSQGTTLNCE